MADKKVRVVISGEDLTVTIVNSGADFTGTEVRSGEDLKIRILPAYGSKKMRWVPC